MALAAYQEQRAAIERYFDRTAAQTWERLTSDAPVSKIRATVRAGRDEMHSTLLSWLPADLSGLRILDAGCGTGTLAIEAAQRGADVTGIDISPQLIEFANQRVNKLTGELKGRIRFDSGDMLDHASRFDHVIAMDSIIHYQPDQIVHLITRMADLAERSVLFTVAPRTPLLAAMHRVGKLFPRQDRSPAIVPIDTSRLTSRLNTNPSLGRYKTGRQHRVHTGFYISHGIELIQQ